MSEPVLKKSELKYLSPKKLKNVIFLLAHDLLLQSKYTVFNPDFLFSY